MENISSLIPLFVIISIVFSIISKAKQNQKKSSNTSSSAGGSQKRSLSLQEIIRRQIEEQKKAMNTSFGQQSAKPEPTAYSSSQENTPTEMQSSSRDAHLNKHYNEGDALNRGSLEGVPTEMQRHSHNAHPGGSYNEGDALKRSSLEGKPILENKDDIDAFEATKVSRIKRKTTKPKRNSLSKSSTIAFKLNRNSIINGIIMSEILTKRGGKRAER